MQQFGVLSLFLAAVWVGQTTLVRGDEREWPLALKFADCLPSLQSPTFIEGMYRELYTASDAEFLRKLWEQSPESEIIFRGLPQKWTYGQKLNLDKDVRGFKTPFNGNMKSVVKLWTASSLHKKATNGSLPRSFRGVLMYPLPELHDKADVRFADHIIAIYRHQSPARPVGALRFTSFVRTDLKPEFRPKRVFNHKERRGVVTIRSVDFITSMELFHVLPSDEVTPLERTFVDHPVTESTFATEDVVKEEGER